MILRLAVIINRSRQSTEITEKFALHVNSDGNKWVLEFEPGYLERNPLTQSDLLHEQNNLQIIKVNLSIR